MRVPPETKLLPATLVTSGTCGVANPTSQLPDDLPVVRCVPGRPAEWKFETAQKSALTVIDIHPFGIKSLVYEFGTAQAIFISALNDPEVNKAVACWKAFGQSAFLFDAPSGTSIFRGPRHFITQPAGNRSMQPDELQPYWLARSVMRTLDEHRRSRFSALPGTRVEVIEAFVLNLPMLDEGIAELKQLGWNPPH